MKWTNGFGREIEWNPGDPWPTQTPEEVESTIRQEELERHGGYYCRDGDHYTWGKFAFPGCCNRCDAAVNRYYDSKIWG